jgi:hypothetical protein
MEILFLFFILFGVGAVLGLSYVGIVAIYRGVRGSIWAGKEVGKSMRAGWREGVEKQRAIEAAKKSARAQN